MTPLVEKRRATIINILYYALILGLCYLLLKNVVPLFFPFIFALFVAIMLNKPISYLMKKTKMKRSFLSIFFVLVFLSLFFGVFFLIIVEIIEKLKGFYQFLLPKLQNMGEFFNDIKLWILSVTDFLPEGIRTVLHENVSVFFDSIIENGLASINTEAVKIDWSSILSLGGHVITGTVSQIPSAAIGFIISIVSCVFISVDYDRIKNFFLRQLSAENAKRMSDGWALGVHSLKKMIKAYCLIILITCTEVAIGLYILKALKIFDSPYILLIAFLIALIDIIPVLGTGTVLIPWAVYSFVVGEVPMGIGLIVMYAVILVIRQIIEPKLVAGQVGLPPIVTIIAMYIGTKVLGALGFFILPFAVILVKVFNDAGLIHVFKDVIDEKSDEFNNEGSEQDRQENDCSEDSQKVSTDAQ